MAGKNKKTESDFIKELEALEQQKKDAMEQLKAYQKSQTDKLGQIYFELKKLENPDISIDELVVETQNKVKEVKEEIKRKRAEEKARKDAEKTNKETYNNSQN
jgi:L-lysine 2,3-aminomutase